MGWIWTDDDRDDSNSNAMVEFQNPSHGDRCSTRRIVKSNCRTEEIEPGRFVHKCEKTEQVLRDCIGMPTEVVQSNKEYTEDDVTDEVTRGSSITGHSDIQPFEFPGLRSDIEAIERSLFGGISRFFDAADEMKNEFFRVFDDLPSVGSDPSSSSPSSSRGRGIPIEDHMQKESTPKQNSSDSGNIDFSGLAHDV